MLVENCSVPRNVVTCAPTNAFKAHSHYPSPMAGVVLPPGSRVLGYGGRVEKWLPVCCIHLTCLNLSGLVREAGELVGSKTRASPGS